MKFAAKLSMFLILACGVVWANSIDYATGTFMSGTLTGSFSTALNISITGSIDTIDLQTGTLIKTTQGCPPGSTCYNFTGGSVTVSNSGGTVFTDSISGGITIKNVGAASVIAVLLKSSSISSGTADASFDFSNGKITAGSENVAVNSATVPEPSTLSLLGLGLVLFATSTRFWRKNVRSKASIAV